MATQTFTANATASLTARGTTTATGTITWTAPSLPAEVASWDSVRISGTWSWGGKGSISRVTINGTNTSGGVAFDISIAGTTSPLSITCVGNKNATGSSFTWSNLVVTYICTLPSHEQLMIKIGGTWQPVTVVYKKINNVWVEQTELANLFDTNTNYVKSN